MLLSVTFSLTLRTYCKGAPFYNAWETRSVFHIPMPRLLGQDCHRRRGPVAQRRVRPLRVVVHPPLLNHHLGLLQRVEDFSVQAFIPQLAVEALAVPVLPRTPGFDVQSL